MHAYTLHDDQLVNLLDNHTEKSIQEDEEILDFVLHLYIIIYYNYLL